LVAAGKSMAVNNRICFADSVLLEV
jgi:hypothetical protein